jgi:hypothetical protein
MGECKKYGGTCDSIPPGSCGPDCHGFEEETKKGSRKMGEIFDNTKSVGYSHKHRFNLEEVSFIEHVTIMEEQENGEIKFIPVIKLFTNGNEDQHIFRDTCVIMFHPDSINIM